MKFRLLLWMLGRLMAKASRDNPAFQKQLEGKDLVFQLHTLDGKVARHYLVRTCASAASAVPIRNRHFPWGSRTEPTVSPR